MSWVQSIKEWAKRLKKQIIMLWFASRHPQMPWLPKIIAVWRWLMRLVNRLNSRLYSYFRLH